MIEVCTVAYLNLAVEGKHKSESFLKQLLLFASSTTCAVKYWCISTRWVPGRTTEKSRRDYG